MFEKSPLFNCFEFEDIKRAANCFRDIELVEILKRTGGKQDRYDKAKWHTCQGIISVTGQKFMNWKAGIGGGGAIDLVIHLNELNAISKRQFSGFWTISHPSISISVKH